MALGAESMTSSSVTNNNSNSEANVNNSYYASADEVAYAIQKYEGDLYHSYVDNGSALNATDAFINDSVNVLTGDVWNSVRTDLKDYVQYANMSEEVNKEISETQQKCLRIIQTFLAPDDDLNTDDLPKLELKRDELKEKIANLESENERLAQVPELIFTGENPNDDVQKAYEHNPAYNVARSKIASNNKIIENELMPALTEVNRLIDKINEFNNVILPLVEKELDGVSDKVNRFAAQVDNIPTSSPSEFVRVLATGAVAFNSAVSGALKAGENLVDGAVWGAGKIATYLFGLDAYLNRLLGQDEVANQLDEISEANSRSLAKWIAIDNVENWNRAFYEGIGSGINDVSYMAYDSEEAQRIQEIAEKGAEVALEVACTVTTGNTALATAIGSVTEMGKAAEELYSTGDNLTLADGTGNIVLHGAVGAANGNATGGFGMSYANAAAGALTETGALAKMVEGIGKAFGKDSFVGNALQVTGNMANRTLEGKENNPLTFVTDIVTEFGLNSLTNTLSSGSTVPAQAFGKILEFTDNINDSGIFDTFSEISGIDLNNIRYFG